MRTRCCRKLIITKSFQATTDNAGRAPSLEPNGQHCPESYKENGIQSKTLALNINDFLQR